MCVCVAKPVAVELRCHATALIAYAKTKTQISFAVTAKLISTFVFATKIVQSLYFLYTKFQASSHLVRLYSPICVGPGRKPRRPVFSQRGSYDYAKTKFLLFMINCGIGNPILQHGSCNRGMKQITPQPWHV